MPHRSPDETDEYVEIQKPDQVGATVKVRLDRARQELADLELRLANTYADEIWALLRPRWLVGPRCASPEQAFERALREADDGWEPDPDIAAFREARDEVAALSRLHANLRDPAVKVVLSGRRYREIMGA